MLYSGEASARVLFVHIGQVNLLPHFSLSDPLHGSCQIDSITPFIDSSKSLIDMGSI